MLPVCLISRDRPCAGPIRRRVDARWFVLLVTAMAALWVSGPSVACAVESDLGYFHPDLEQALGALERAEGGVRVSALRGVWRLWDRAEPEQVEAALVEAGTRQSWSPAERSYARLLAAYARLRRGDVKGARGRIRDLGYIDKWLVLGPFDNTGRTGFEQELVPQKELGMPLVFGRGYSGKEGRLVRWRRVPDAFPYGWVDAGALLRPFRPICTFFASHVSQPGLESARDLTVWVGARGAHRVYWNDKLVLEEPVYRGHDFDRRSAPIGLTPGLNRITIEVCTETAAPMLSVRLGDSEGRAVPNVRWQVEGAGIPLMSSRLSRRRAGPKGPLDWFEQKLKSQPRDARLKENFARYLKVTGGDDRVVHQARDLALGAAEAQGSTERWLLTASLATDRNQRGEWLGRAEAALAQTEGDDGLRLRKKALIARAHWLEAGLSPRLALPLYQQVLTVDPENVEALSGAVRLYEAVGLRQSALALVESSRMKHPHAVGLLNLQEGILTGLGRTREAERVRSLYSAVRFDDQRPLLNQLELARREQNSTLADHYAQRLIALSPDNPWLYGVIASVHRGLSRPERAIASYQRALALAPGDEETLRQLADMHGFRGAVEEQVVLLRQLLGRSPQNEEVRRYIAALEPAAAREDEKYAWSPKRFLDKRFGAPKGHHQRTLLDLTVTQVYDNGASARFRQVVFQPLTDTGAALARQYAFSFQADRQRAQLRGAHVYRGSGKVDEAIESGVGAADNPALSMYTSARTFFVQFPRLEPGDVVELQYRIDDVGDRNEWSGYFGEVQQFQKNVPVDHAEYIVITPENRKLYVDAQRIDGLQVSEEKREGQRVHRFVAENLPAILPEADMPPWSEVAGFVHVSTYPSYSELGEWYWGLSRDQLRLDEPTRQVLEKIVAGATSDREKVEAVYGWVVESTRYVALEFGIHGYKPRSCAQTVARGWGDCKDKATVIVAMLKELGIDATVVLVRTGMRGRFQSSVASLSPFDHAIAYVPSLDLYLDGTAEYTGSTELPAMDRGALALQINEGNAKLVHLPDHDPEQHVRRRHIEVFPSKRRGARVVVRYEVGGPAAASWRRRYSAASTQRERVVSDVRSQFAALEVLPGAAGLKVGPLSDLEVRPWVEVTGDLAQLGRVEGTRRSLAVLPELALTSSHARLASRRTELAIQAPATLEDTYVLHLAAGQRVDALPPTVDETTPFGRYRTEVRQEGRIVTAFGRLELSVTRVSPSDYAEFREFCQRADEVFGTRLVLSKGGE